MIGQLDTGKGKIIRWQDALGECSYGDEGRPINHTPRMDLGVGAKRPPRGGDPDAAFAGKGNMGWKSAMRTKRPLLKLRNLPYRLIIVELSNYRLSPFERSSAFRISAAVQDA